MHVCHVYAYIYIYLFICVTLCLYLFWYFCFYIEAISRPRRCSPESDQGTSAVAAVKASGVVHGKGSSGIFSQKWCRPWQRDVMRYQVGWNRGWAWSMPSSRVLVKRPFQRRSWRLQMPSWWMNALEGLRWTRSRWPHSCTASSTCTTKRRNSSTRSRRPSTLNDFQSLTQMAFWARMNLRPLPTGLLLRPLWLPRMNGPTRKWSIWFFVFASHGGMLATSKTVHQSIWAGSTHPWSDWQATSSPWRRRRRSIAGWCSIGTRFGPASCKTHQRQFWSTFVEAWNSWGILKIEK